MSEPNVYSKKPVKLTLEESAYFWCSCGRSENQPFCDGSHQGTDFIPLEFLVEETKQVVLCNCKHTRTPPFCDGSHNDL